MSDKKSSIVLVEDERIIALDIAQTLEYMGFDVKASFATGEDVLDYIHKNKPDLILMDIMLQGCMDGIETVGKIKRIRDIPVVYMTAYTDEETKKRANTTNPLAIIPKPVNQRKLADSLSQFMQTDTKKL
ncbi:MAG: response regulator [Spirochaetia bacterium]